jgi:hypothetical protein
MSASEGTPPVPPCQPGDLITSEEDLAALREPLRQMDDDVELDTYSRAEHAEVQRLVAELSAEITAHTHQLAALVTQSARLGAAAKSLGRLIGGRE